MLAMYLGSLGVTAVGSAARGYEEHVRDNGLQYDPDVAMGMGLIGGIAEVIGERFMIGKLNLPQVQKIARLGQKQLIFNLSRNQTYQKAAKEAFTDFINRSPKAKAKFWGHIKGMGKVGSINAVEEGVTEAMIVFEYLRIPAGDIPK